MTGESVSSNVTKKKQRVEFSKASVAVHVMSVDPGGKDDPEGGAHATLALVQLSVAVAAG
jgi:hypothetical protein